MPEDNYCGHICIYFGPLELQLHVDVFIEDEPRSIEELIQFFGEITSESINRGIAETKENNSCH